MRPIPAANLLPLVLLFAAGAAGCSSESLKAAAPTAGARKVAVAELPPLPPSVIDAPISFALDPAIEALERAVPRTFGDMERRITNPGNKRQQFAFQATRSPFRVSVRGQHLTLETVLEYQGRGWYDPPLAPTLSASCGTGGERPRLRLVLSSDLALSRNWKLRAATRLDTLAPYSDSTRDECRVTILAFDVTDRVVNAVHGALQKQMPRIDERLGNFDVRTPLERWYNLLNREIRVSDSMWLVFNPSDVQFGGLRVDDNALVADVRLFARPVLYTGMQPSRVTRSLPPLVRAQRRVGDSLRVLVDGRLDYDVASARLQKALGGRSFSRLGRSVRIDSAFLDGLGDGRVVMTLVFRGAVAGRAYLVGTPQLDRATHMLTVPDLDFDVATSSSLARGVAWLTREDIVLELRKRAQLPLTEVVDKVRDRVETAVNRDLATGIHLAGDLRSGRLVDVVALENELLVRSEVTGSLALSIDREIPVRKKRN